MWYIATFQNCKKISSALETICTDIAPFLTSLLTLRIFIVFFLFQCYFSQILIIWRVIESFQNPFSYETAWRLKIDRLIDIFTLSSNFSSVRLIISLLTSLLDDSFSCLYALGGLFIFGFAFFLTKENIFFFIKNHGPWKYILKKNNIS